MLGDPWDHYMSLSYALLWMLLFLFQNVEATGWLDVHFKANEFFFFKKPHQTQNKPKHMYPPACLVLGLCRQDGRCMLSYRPFFLLASANSRSRSDFPGQLALLYNRFLGLWRSCFHRTFLAIKIGPGLSKLSIRGNQSLYQLWLSLVFSEKHPQWEWLK